MHMINFFRDSFTYLFYSKKVTVEAVAQIKTGAGLVIYNITGPLRDKSVSHTVGVCFCLAQDILCNVPLRGPIETTIKMLCTSSEGVFLDVCPKNIVEGYVYDIPAIMLTAGVIVTLVSGLMQLSRTEIHVSKDQSIPKTAGAAKSFNNQQPKSFSV